MTTHYCTCPELYPRAVEEEQKRSLQSSPSGDDGRAALGEEAKTILCAIMKGILIASAATLAIPVLLSFGLMGLDDFQTVGGEYCMMLTRFDVYIGVALVLNLALAFIGFTLPTILDRKSRN